MISEQYILFDRSISQIKNHIFFPASSNLRKNFVIKDDYIYFFNNFDLVNKILLSHYKNVELSNFFVYNIHQKFPSASLKIDLDYITEIHIMGEFIVIVGFKFNHLQFFINFYSISENLIKFTKVLPFENKNRVSINPSIPSNCSFVLGGRVLCILINGENYYEVEVKNQKLIINTFNDDLNKFNNEINYLTCDNFKIGLASGDNTIKVFSAKDKKLWYTLLSGSLTVMPKSFIADPNVKGFSKIIMTKTSIIASIGNLIRKYDFILNK